VAVYFCWLCERQLDTVFLDLPCTDRHYETGRQIFFCSYEHYSEYQDLKRL
jgi:hypothetical protein